MALRGIRKAAVAALMGALLLGALAAQGEEAYTRKAAWAETMLATRAAHRAAGVSADDAKTTAAWKRFEEDFPLAAMRLGRDLDAPGLRSLLTAADPAAAEKKMIAAALQGIGAAGLEHELQALAPAADGSAARLELYERACAARKLADDLKLKVNFRALRMAIEDLAKSFPEQYAGAQGLLARADALQARLPEAERALAAGSARELQSARRFFEDYTALQREALLANPLLDFDKLLLIKRKPLGNPYRYADPDKGTGKYIGMPQQSSYQLHTMSSSWAFSFDNEIDALPVHRPDAPLETVFKSTQNRLVSDMDLHFSGDRVLFSMPDERKLWQLFEYNIAGGKLRQVSRGDQPDVHNLDGCYLPNGRIAFISTAVFQGVPCNASVNVGMMYCMDNDGGNVRQLTFDQDHNFCPTVTPDGRIMYLRWEYADIPHVWARYIFTMNPDGTSQRELFGTGSYWPNGMWYARPVPNTTKFAAIVTGHHVGRQGELYIFDPARSHDGTKGCVQQIPGWGKPVQPAIKDKLTETVYPKFLHPWPLSEKYLLVACRPTPEDMWGIYLVDTFDNMVPVKSLEGWALLEPTPLKKTPTPPALEDRVNLARKDSLIFINDIYKGRGLEGVPRGAVKSLRLVTYHFAYRTVAGIDHRVGADGPWEPKVILGTVPVEPDGSVFFRVPANTPLTVHALDEKGRTIQIMRSWMTAMPGEILSCVGCHEQTNCAPPNAASVSLGRRPVEITPWRGPARGFDFVREVQPVLDKFCVGCHDGSRSGLPNLRRDQEMVVAYKKDNPEAKLVKGPITEELYKKYGGLFPPAYIALRRLVRPSGIESDLRPLNSMEFDVRTTELVQMLEKGHRGVRLDAEAWDRLYTWIDLNTPCHGTWQEVVGGKKIENDHERRLAMMKAYSGIYEDPEVVRLETAAQVAKPVKPAPERKAGAKPAAVEGWPLNAADAAARQGASGQTRRTLDLGGGVTLELARIPAGRFVMGSATGAADEAPQSVVEIKKPFWMGVCEVSNAQYQRFNPQHDSRFEHKGTWKFEEVDLGWPLNDPRQPAVRISWEEAMGFCAWLSAKTGARVSLPTEAQWEYACRAGSATPFWYGGLEADFAPFANLGDASLRALAWGLRSPKPPDLAPRDDRFSDGLIVTGAVGGFKPNPWGLCDMHGNVWEWTRSMYKGYPYVATDGREAAEGADAQTLRVARGGSWNDRPLRCTASYRIGYPAWQRVYNVGFRVALEEDEPVRVAGR